MSTLLGQQQDSDPSHPTVMEDKPGDTLLTWQGYHGDIHPSTFDIFTSVPVKQVAMGTNHHLFLTFTQEVYALGDNQCGQLGIPSVNEKTEEPCLITALTGKSVISVVCGHQHSAALCENGQIYCWGDSDYGQCGLGDATKITSPEIVNLGKFDKLSDDVSTVDNESSLNVTVNLCSQCLTGNVPIRQISCGKQHTLALSQNGDVWAWGSGIQLGIMDVQQTKYPVKVSTLSKKKVISVHCGSSHSLALIAKMDYDFTTKRSKGKKGLKASSEIKVHEHRPTICANCNKSIFRMEEVNDTCIIKREHKCSFEEENSPKKTSEEVLKKDTVNSIFNGNGSMDLDIFVDAKADVVSDRQRNKEDEKHVGMSNNDSDLNLDRSNNMPDNVVTASNNLAKMNLELVTSESNSDYDVSQTNVSVQSPMKLDEDSVASSSSKNENSNVIQNVVENDPLNCHPGSKSLQSSETRSQMVDRDDTNEDIWCKREDFVEPSSATPLDNSNSHISFDSSGDFSPTRAERSRSSSIRSERSQKSHTILDENEARQYLAKQFEDENMDVKGKSRTLSGSSLNPFRDKLSGPSGMIQQVQQVSSMTTSMLSTWTMNMVDKLGFGSDSDTVELGKLAEEPTNQEAVTPSSVSNSDSNSDSVSYSTSKETLSESSFMPGETVTQDTGNAKTSVSEATGVLSEEPISRHSPHTPVLRREQIELRKEGKGNQLSSRRSHKDVETDDSDASSVTIDTEVWTWGSNNRGQLGLGDMLDRPTPMCIKLLGNKNIVKIMTKVDHTLALTASGQAWAWGRSKYGQSGHTEIQEIPNKVKSLLGLPVWDIAVGTSHSLFLVDTTGFQADVYYAGKHADPSSSDKNVIKTAQPVPLTFLKQPGWTRCILAGGDNCMCLIDQDSSGNTATKYELTTSERRFYIHLCKIAALVLRPINKHEFYTSMDAPLFKTTLQSLLRAFGILMTKVGEKSVELTSVVQNGGTPLQASMMDHFEAYIDDYRTYLSIFGDFLAIGGFDYCAKIGSGFFEKLLPVFTDLLEEGNVDAKPSVNFRRIMQTPLRRMMEYSRLATKLALHYPQDSHENILLNKVSLNWDSARQSIIDEHVVCNKTSTFWTTCNAKLVLTALIKRKNIEIVCGVDWFCKPIYEEALRIPSRRLVRDSKTFPLTVPSAGRFTQHMFFLFNDIFVHAQRFMESSLKYNSHQILPLLTVWAEAATDAETHNAILLTAPEELLTLSASGPAEKAEWLMALNQAINKVLSSQKSVCRRGSAERLTPPLVRHAKYVFYRSGPLKDAIFTGYWLSGKMNGQGELRWLDETKYVGKFKLGLQHGYGMCMVPRGEGMEVYEGEWKDGKFHGQGTIKYANGDTYDGYFKDGYRSGHGIYQQGRHTTTSASVYIGEWLLDKKTGYGVMDDVLKGEKYMGQWHDDQRHGNGIVVTLDGMYFEGNFVQGKMMGFGLMLTDDDSSYEGDFSGITQLSGKGVLTMPNGDQLEGSFIGSWNEGLKVNGMFRKNDYSPAVTDQKMMGISSKYYGKLSVSAAQKWEDIFVHCRLYLGHHGVGKVDTEKAWEMAAIMISASKRHLEKKAKKVSPTKTRYRKSNLEDLEKIPPHNKGKLTIEYYNEIRDYLLKAFETTHHPLGKMLDVLVDVFRAAYIGIGAHPRLLYHAISEVRSYVYRIYHIIRILFPDIPKEGAKHIYPEGYVIKSASISDGAPGAAQGLEQEDVGEIMTAAGLLHPILLPKIYPPLFDLYALYTERDDDKYWERVQKLNRQGDMALMAYLGIDQRFWLIDEAMFKEKRQKLSSMRDQCYTSAIDTLQQISTAFCPADKLKVIQQTFIEITAVVQSSVRDDYVWCMDELFPIFQYIVVRSKIRHLGAEIHLIDDLMELHLEYGELGIMFTTLKACYFQIQNEKMPIH